MNSIIIYYSRAGENYFGGSIRNLKEGNASHIAKEIAKQTNAELYEVTSDRVYSNDYRTCTEEASEDLKANLRPKITSKKIDLTGYSPIFLVYPNWWGTMPAPMMSFLEQHDLADKTIIPVCTHEGSGLGNSVSTLRSLAPKAHIEHQFSIRGSDALTCEGQIKDWLSSF